MALTEFSITMSLVLIPVYIRNLGASITQVGIFFTVSLVFALVARLFGGWLADIIGRLQVIFIGSIGGVLAFSIYALAPSWQVALLAPAMLAITESLTIPAFAAYIADITPETSRGRMFGLSQTIYRGASVVAPVIGGLLVAAIGFRFMFGFSAVSFFVACLIFAFLLRSAPTKSKSDQQVTLSSLKNSIVGMWTLFVAGGVIAWLLAVDGVRDVALKLSIDLIPVYLTDVQGVRVQDLGLMEGLYGLALLLTLYPAGLLVDRTSERTVYVLSLTFTVFSRLVLALSGDFLGFSLSFVLQAIGAGLFYPSANALIAKEVPQKLRGVAYGLFATTLGIFSLPAPWIGSQLWEFLGPRVPFLATVAIGALIIIPAWVKLRLPTKSKRRDGADQAITVPTGANLESATVLYAALGSGVDESFHSKGLEIVAQHGGVASLTEESALAGTFGISPNRSPPQVSALLATHAALSIVDYIDELNRDRSANGLTALKMGIGVDTGEIGVRSIVPGRQIDQSAGVGKTGTAMEDLFRRATALQLLADGGAVLFISETTYDYLAPAHDQFRFKANRKVNLTGKEDATAAYEVVGRTQSLSSATVASETTPF